MDSEYEEFIASYQFNLNVYDVKNGKKYIDEYYLRNDEGEILSDGFRISNLKLLDFYDLWYNHSEELNDPGWRKMAFMGALLLENDKEMFNKLLDDAPNDFSDLKVMIRTIMKYLNNDSELVEKIQSSLINTIPLWKNQIVIAWGISNAKNALGAQKQVTEMTNDMLKKNSELLKQGTIEIAEESEKAIVDVETLQKTNQDIIETLDKVLEIHENGRVKRQEAEQELEKIEGELKDKLLEIKIERRK